MQKRLSFLPSACAQFRYCPPSPPPSSNPEFRSCCFSSFFASSCSFCTTAQMPPPPPVSRKGSNERSLGLVTSPGLSPSCVTPLRSHTYACVRSTALFGEKSFGRPRAPKAYTSMELVCSPRRLRFTILFLFLAKNVAGLICSCGGKPISL